MTDFTEKAKAWIELMSLDDDDPKIQDYHWLEEFEFDIVDKNPDLALDFILEILSLNPSNVVIEVLAAGPLESVLSKHGIEIISRVENQARNNPQFAMLLGGVWKSTIDDQVWQRVQAVWDRTTWDINPS